MAICGYESLGPVWLVYRLANIAWPVTVQISREAALSKFYSPSISVQAEARAVLIMGAVHSYFLMSKIGTFDVNHHFQYPFLMGYPKKMAAV